MDRNSPKRMVCSSGFSESPIRWNSVTIVRLGSSVLLGHLLKKKEHWEWKAYTEKTNTQTMVEIHLT
jgi:hypothetical protein